MTVATFKFEHILPHSNGGETVFENVCLDCPTRNRYKSDRKIVIDLETNEEVRLFHPHLDDWSDHFAWNEATTELIAKTSIGRVTISDRRFACQRKRPLAGS